MLGHPNFCIAAEAADGRAGMLLDGDEGVMENRTSIEIKFSFRIVQTLEVLVEPDFILYSLTTLFTIRFNFNLYTHIIDLKWEICSILI